MFVLPLSLTNIAAITAINVGVPLPFSCILQYSGGAWQEPTIINSTSEKIPLACNGIQLGESLLDSYRWFPGVDGKYRTFRNDYKFKQMSYGASKMVLEEIPVNKYYGCLIKFLNRAKEYKPDPKKKQSIYVRVNYFESKNSLVTRHIGDTTFTITGHVSNDLYVNTLPSIKLRVETAKYKNYDGSMANVKSAAKYGPTFYADKLAKSEGCDSSLFLYPKPLKRVRCIAETSYGNVFMVMGSKVGNKRTLVTLSGDSIIYHGSYRNSTIALSEKIPDLNFRYDCIDIDLLETLVNQKILLEMFTTGNYVQVTPITEVKLNGKSIQIPTLKQSNPIYLQIKKSLNSQCFGETQNSHQWMYCVNSAGNGLSPC